MIHSVIIDKELLTTNMMTTTNASLCNVMVNVKSSTEDGHTHLSTLEWDKALRHMRTSLTRKLVWCIPAEVDTVITFHALSSVHSLHLQVPHGMEIANFNFLPLTSLSIIGGKVHFPDLVHVAAGSSCELKNLRLLNTTLVGVEHHSVYTTSCSPMETSSRPSQLIDVNLQNVTGLTSHTAHILLGSASVSTLSVHECSHLNELPTLDLSRCSVLRTDSVADALVTYIMNDNIPERWMVIALTGYIKIKNIHDFFTWCMIMLLPKNYALLACKGFNNEKTKLCLQSVTTLHASEGNYAPVTLILINQRGERMWTSR
jgi:hypothetical protein